MDDSSGTETTELRVMLTDVPIGGRFCRVGARPLGWCIRLTEEAYCEPEDLKEGLRAVARYPVRPGPEMYASVDQLLAMPKKDMAHLVVWNRLYDFRVGDKKGKGFLVPVG